MHTRHITRISETYDKTELQQSLKRIITKRLSYGEGEKAQLYLAEALKGGIIKANRTFLGFLKNRQL
jgi:hypothetical protein